MDRNSLQNVLFSAELSKVHFIVPVFFAILISAIFAQIVLVAQPISGSTGVFNGIDGVFAAVNILVITIVSIIGLFLFFHFFKKNRSFALRTLIAAFILGGVLSSLLFGKLVFTLIGLASPIFLLVVAIITYSGAYFAYLVLVDALPKRTKNLLFIFCSGVLGAFLGVLIPTILSIMISLFLSILDLVLIEKNIVENIVGEETYGTLLTEITFSNCYGGVGIGDLTCYSLVVSNTLINFGIYIGSLSLLMILLGVVLTLALAIKRTRLPGLPIAIALGVLPSIFLLTFR